MANPVTLPVVVDVRIDRFVLAVDRFREQCRDALVLRERHVRALIEDEAIANVRCGVTAGVGLGFEHDVLDTVGTGVRRSADAAHTRTEYGQSC